jgi:hypothetical protein
VLHERAVIAPTFGAEEVTVLVIGVHSRLTVGIPLAPRTVKHVAAIIVLLLDLTRWIPGA